jgi:ketosteroid isomerase-like protein
MRRLLGFSLLAALAACSGGAQQQAAETTRLLDADRALAVASMEQGSAAAFYAAMSEDALMLPAAAEPVQGRDKIRERLKGLGAEVLDWTPRKAEVSRSLDLGWTWGEWQLYDSATTKHLLAEGKYLRTWKRAADGHWQLQADIGNQPPAPPPQLQPDGSGILKSPRLSEGSATIGSGRSFTHCRRRAARITV